MLRYPFLLYIVLACTLSQSACDDSTASVDEGPAPDAQRRILRLDMGVADVEVDADKAEAMSPGIDANTPPMPDAMVDVFLAMDSGPPVPPLDCDEDTAELPADVVGDFGPLTRINQLRIPASVDAARAAGCDLVGRNKGSGLANLMTTFMLDLNSQVRADANGQIATIILGEMAGWSPGQTGNQARSVNLNFYSGDQGEAGLFTIDRDSFINGDPDSDPRVSLEAATICGELATEQGDFDLSLPVDDIRIDLSLAQALITGDLNVSPRGVSVDGGLIMGYLTTTGLTEMLRAVQIACAAESPPDFCDEAGTLLGGDPAALAPIAALLLGGFDLVINADGGVSEECGFECNAISVCLEFSSIPAIITGISD
jgi:hypothetical protein